MSTIINTIMRAKEFIPENNEFMAKNGQLSAMGSAQPNRPNTKRQKMKKIEQMFKENK